jgi:hypothetical protein
MAMPSREPACPSGSITSTPIAMRTQRFLE